MMSREHERAALRIVILLCCLILGLVGQVGLYAQPQDDITDWKKKSRSYVKDPLLLKEEIRMYRDSIANLKQANKALEMAGSGADASYWREVDSLQQVIAKVKQELRFLIQRNAELEQVSEAREQVIDLGIKSGLVYRLMLDHEAQDLAARRTFSEFVIGNFRTLANAERFQEQMNSLGFAGNSQVVAYIDGVQVELSEAADYERQQGIK